MPADFKAFRTAMPNLQSVTSKAKRPPRHQRGEQFLKGPIPMPWLQLAIRQPGKALHIAVAIWFYAGLTGTNTVALNLSRLSEFGIQRDAARRGLEALEAANLIAVDRRVGRKPIITILPAPTTPATPQADTHPIRGEQLEHGKPGV